MKKYLYLILLLSLTSIRFKTNYFPPISDTTWETLNPIDLSWCEYEIENLYSFLDETNTKAFIVLKDGKIVLEKYFDDFSKDSNWYWASAGKTLTAVAIGMAQQDGFLSIDDRSSQYLGEGWTSLSKEQEDKITIRNQLTMTTGLKDAVADPFCTDVGCLQFEADAGTRWAYHNAPYTLLDQVIASASGTTLNQYFTNKIRNKIGMNGLYIKSGFNNVYYSNARSMARFGLFILNNGAWSGEQIMTDLEYFNAMIRPSQELNQSYGYLWWLNGQESFMIPQLRTVFPGALNPNAPADMISAMGKNGQLINVVPSENLVMIRMGEAPGESQEVTILYNDQIWQNFNKIKCEIAAGDEEEITNPAVKIFPNPANDKTTIQLPGHIFHCELRNISGKLIVSKQNCLEQIVINTEELPHGVYFLKLSNRKGWNAMQKIVIH